MKTTTMLGELWRNAIVAVVTLAVILLGAAIVATLW
jgi:hypothetical protein